MEQVLRTLTLDFFGKGQHKVSPDQLLEMENAFLLDIRSREEAASLSIKLAYHFNVQCENIPIDEIPDRIHEIPKDKSVAVFCSGVIRAAIVYAYLLSKGFGDVRVLEGGYSALTEALKPGKVLKTIQRKDQ